MFEYAFVDGLIVEVPADTEVNAFRIHRIVWSPEISSCGLICMIVLYVESSALEREIGVCTDEWIVTYLDAVIRVLRREIADNGRIIGCIVFCEILEVGSDFTAEYLCNFEIDVKVVIGRNLWKRKYIVVGASLECEVVVEMENAKLEVLSKCGTNDLYVLATLLHDDIISIIGVISLDDSRSFVSEISIILNVLYVRFQVGVGFRQMDFSSDSSLSESATLVLPPKVLGVKMVVKETWFCSIELGIYHHLCCVAQ